MNPDRTDPRVTRTVLALEQAVVDLASQRPVSQITVADLAQKSGLPGPKLDEALDKLVADGYIKIFSTPAAAAAAPSARPAPAAA